MIPVAGGHGQKRRRIWAQTGGGGYGYNRERNEFACRVVQLEQFIEPRGNWPITAALGIGEGCDSVDNAMEES